MAHSGESIWRDGIAFEELGRIYLETVTSKVVGKELDDLLMGLGGGGSGGTTYTVIREFWGFDAKDVCQVDDGLVFRMIDLRSSDVCLDAIDLFERPLSSKCWVLKSKSSKIRIGEFTLRCALIANACEGLRY